MKSVGAKQRKPKTGFVDSKNPALASWRKWKKIEKARKQAEVDVHFEIYVPFVYIF